VKFSKKTQFLTFNFLFSNTLRDIICSFRRFSRGAGLFGLLQMIIRSMVDANAYSNIMMAISILLFLILISSDVIRKLLKWHHLAILCIFLN
jgi:hypothetical protein